MILTEAALADLVARVLRARGMDDGGTGLIAGVVAAAEREGADCLPGDGIEAGGVAYRRVLDFAGAVAA